MSTWRKTTIDTCPIYAASVAMDDCQPCRFFRGATSSDHARRGWNVCCNYPRDGSYIATDEPTHETTSDAPIPAVFRDAF